MPGGDCTNWNPKEPGNVPAEALVELFPTLGRKRLEKQGKLFECR